jgi:uncharacterized membrane protein YGL010W
MITGVLIALLSIASLRNATHIEWYMPMLLTSFGIIVASYVITREPESIKILSVIILILSGLTIFYDRWGVFTILALISGLAGGVGLLIPTWTDHPPSTK